MKSLSVNELKNILKQVQAEIQSHEEELCKLDARVGDGDHGTTMCRGITTAWQAVKNMDFQTPKALIMEFGKKFIASAGGAIGPIFGTFFVELGRSLEHDSLTMENFLQGLKRSHEKMTDLGGAKLGDKTLLDVLIPSYQAMQVEFDQNKDLATIIQVGKTVAQQSLEKTKDLQAKRGRAKFLQEGSIGVIDAGATSFCIVLNVFLDHWDQQG